MYEVSERFLLSVATSHETTAAAEVWRDGAYVQSLAVLGGSITVDESSKVRRSLTLTAADIDLDPRTAEDLLSPFGTELHVYSGLRFTEGDTEAVPVGVYPIQSAGRSGWLDDLGIQADDRSRTIADSRLLRPYTPSVSTTALGAITVLAQEVIPSVEVYDLTTDLRVTRATLGAVTYERERWDAIEAIASGLGCEAFFDAEGRLIVREVPVVSALSSSVWTVAAGAEDAVMLDIATSLSADKVYNAVVASSSGDADAPVVTAIVYQDAGPLRWRPGVQRPRFYASPLIKTTEQAIEAGRSILARSLVYAQGVGLETLPNPALDVGDVIGIRHPDGFEEQRVVSRITLPIALEGMRLDTRVGIDAASATDVGDLS